MKKKNKNDYEGIKKTLPVLSFSRGTTSYVVLAIILLVILFFGFFDPRSESSKDEILGSYGKYVIVAKKQGMNVYEVFLRKEENTLDKTLIPIDNIKNVIWIVGQSFEIQSFHPIEKNGEIHGLIVTTQGR